MTRKELYDLIWSTPMTVLSKKFAITDSKLRSLCKKHNIPIPQVGYWQRLKYSKQIEIPDLPLENSTTTKSTIDLLPVKVQKVDRLKQIRRILRKAASSF